MPSQFSKIDCLIALLACLVFSSIAKSESSHHDEHGHGSKQDKHLHGVSELMLALDKGSLEIHFESPAANIVGFEHKARTQDQIKMLNEAKDILDTPEKIFVFIGGDCDLQMSDVNIAGLLNETQTEHREHREHREHKEHKEHKGHEGQEERDHGSHPQPRDPHDKGDHHDQKTDGSNLDHHEVDDATHKEITAEYKYMCKNGDTLRAVEVNLIKIFSGIEKLKVYWLTDSMQGSIDLTGKSGLINIR